MVSLNEFFFDFFKRKNETWSMNSKNFEITNIEFYRGNKIRVEFIRHEDNKKCIISVYSMYKGKSYKEYKDDDVGTWYYDDIDENGNILDISESGMKYIVKREITDLCQIILKVYYRAMCQDYDTLEEASKKGNYGLPILKLIATSLLLNWRDVYDNYTNEHRDIDSQKEFPFM